MAEGQGAQRATFPAAPCRVAGVSDRGPVIVCRDLAELHCSELVCGSVSHVDAVEVATGAEHHVRVRVQVRAQEAVLGAVFEMRGPASAATASE